jgi:hypothetical protein
VDCLGKPIFFVGVRIVDYLFHSTQLKEEGNPNFILPPHFFIVHDKAIHFVLHIILENLSSDHLDLSLLENVFFLLPSVPSCSYFLRLVVQLCVRLLVHMVFSLCFI